MFQTFDVMNPPSYVWGVGKSRDILGIDPGTHNTGVGIVRIQGNGDLKCLLEGLISLKGEKLAERLGQLGEKLESIIETHQPSAVVVEKSFFAKNADSAMKLGHARGVCLYVAAKHRIPIFEYNPTAVKLGLVGNGRAQKEQIEFMVKNILGLKTVSSLDTSDALALAIHHGRISETQGRIDACEQGERI